MTAAPALVPVPARLVTRISEDPNDTRTGVSRQFNLGHELAARIGWAIEREHRDNNRSGWKPGVLREEYELLLTDIRAGRVHAVIAYDQDRITRQTEQWAAFRRLCKKHGVRVAFVNDGGEVKIGTVSGGLSTGLRALMAEGESEIKSQRCLDTSDERARAGKANGVCAYGWRRVVTHNDRGVKVAWHDELHTEHAQLLREIARDVLKGKGLRTIANELNAQRVPPPGAGTQRGKYGLWTATTLRKLLLRPANIGQRVHRGEVLKGVIAEAPAIFDELTQRKLRAILTDPKRRTVEDARVRHLLTSITSCGKCGGPMRARGIYVGERKRQPSYVCQRSCVAVPQAAADTYVTETLVAYLSRATVADLVPDEGDATTAIAELELLSARKSEAEKLFGDGVLDAAGLGNAMTQIREQISAAQAKLDAFRVSPGLSDALALAQSDDLRAALDVLTIERMRKLLASLFDLRMMPTLYAGRRLSIDERVLIERKS